MSVSFLVPVRYSSWLANEIGTTLQGVLQDALPVAAQLTRLPRGFLVEGLQDTNLPEVLGAARALDAHVGQAYPVFYKELGPVWTGTVQAVEGVA